MATPKFLDTLTALQARSRILWMRADPYVIRGIAKRYRKGMALFWWYGVFISMSSAFVDSFVTLFILSLGATSLQIGTLSSLSSLFGMLMPLPGAQWAARWGKRKEVVLISFGLRYLVLLLAMLMPLIVRSPAVVFFVIGLFALRAAFLYLGNSPWTSFAGSLVPQNRRGRYFSSRKTVMALASLVFVPVAGQLIGLFPEPFGYQVSIALAIVWGAVALYLFGRIPEETDAGGGTSRKISLAFWKILGRNHRFLQFTLISMLFNFAWQFGGPYFGVYQVEVLGSTSRIIGWLSMVSSLMRMLGQQIWGRAMDRRGTQWVFTMVLLFIPLVPLIWIPLTAPWQVIFVYIPSGFLWAGQEVANFNLILELADGGTRDGDEAPQAAHVQTQAIASYNTLVAVANVLGPLVGGFVVQWLGYHWVFALSGLGRMVAAVLFLFLLRPFGLMQSSRQTEAPSRS